MHDPCTVAFEIRSPFWAYKPWPKVLPYKGAPRKKRRTARNWEELSPEQRNGRDKFWKKGYRNTIVTIWHTDPERDGSDDSCGWCYPRLKPEQIERLKNAAWGEGRDPYFLRCKRKKWVGTRHEAEAMYRGLVLFVADHLGIKLSYEQAARKSSRAIHHPDCSDAASAFCFRPGWHTNFDTDTPDQRQEVFMGVICGISRELLRERRHWWQHPKWHIHHWKFQVHPVQQFKRWAFSRCCKCGKGFTWGYSPISNQWHGMGPRWFRGERDVMHHECSNTAVGQMPRADVLQPQE